MRYLIVDASLHGTGIRDEYEGGYIDPETLGLSSNLKERLKDWVLKYENEHYNNYSNPGLVEELDNVGKDLATQIKKEFSEAKVAYYSDAKMRKEVIM